MSSAPATVEGGASLHLRVPSTLRFGRGALAAVAPLLAELGCARPLLVTDAGVAATGLPARLEQGWTAAGLAVGCWAEVTPEPDERQPEACRDVLLAGGHDAVVAVGGGSVLDVAKVAAVLATNGGRSADCFGFDRVRRPGLPVITAPTTAGGGGEVSSHAVIVQLSPRKKEVVAGLHLLPRAAVVDPEATLTLPPEPTAYAGADGLIHAIEAFLARRATPFTDAFARLALPAIAAALPRAVADGRDLAAREQLSLGCLYSGLAMANANAGAIHALGYPLTGGYGIPHGLANALMAAATLRRVASAASERSAELVRLLAGEPAAEAADLPLWLGRFLARLGILRPLAAWGIAAADLPRLAEQATQFQPVLHNTPVALTGDDLLAIYREVHAGQGSLTS